MEQRIFTTGQIAKYCGVDYRTVIRWIERGKLKAFKLPGRGDHRIAAGDFLDFLRNHKMPVPEDLAPAPPKRVLIVEDDPQMAKSIQRALKRRGYDTKIAHDGFEAGALLGIFVPGVVTLDLQMPGLGGLAVLRFIRHSEPLKEIRVLVVSGLGREDLDKALAAGANDVLAKPFTNKELLEKVSNLIGEC